MITELQCSIELEGQKFGELIGNLDVTSIVRFSWISFLLGVSCGVPFLQYTLIREENTSLRSLLSMVTRNWLISDPGETDASRGEVGYTSEATSDPVAQRGCRSCLFRYGRNSEADVFLQSGQCLSLVHLHRIILQ